MVRDASGRHDSTGGAANDDAGGPSMAVTCRTLFGTGWRSETGRIWRRWSGGALGLFLNAASLWSPAYMPESAWIEHAPLAFALVGAHRPHAIVVLGVDRSFLYDHRIADGQRRGPVVS